jgi:hypothetical protein
LAVYYGWEGWEVFHGKSAWSNVWRKRIEALLKQPGIVAECVYVGRDELQREFASSSLWLYPTEATEVSCINAMTAQLNGAFPVTTSVGALSETVHGGYIVDSTLIYTDSKAQAEFVDAAVRLLLTPSDVERSVMMSRARERFVWTSVAREWSSRFAQVTCATGNGHG